MVADRRGVKVVHGANDGEFEVAGETVGRVRASLTHAFNIPDDAIALADGRRITDGFRLADNSVLEFVRESGVKGAGKKGTASPPDDDGDDHAPDYSKMDLDKLSFCIQQRLSRSEQANRLSALQAHKSAVHLFWAGGALARARELCEQEGHGKWKEWKLQLGLADTTVNDAIRLFKNAKTPDALKGLGITEAKQKFVYPAKDEENDPATKPVRGQAAAPKKATRPSIPKGGDKQPVPAEGQREPSGTPPKSLDKDESETSTVTDPADAIAEALEDIAQQLNDIVQDHLGKVVLTQPLPPRFTNALQAVGLGLKKLLGRINRDQPNS